jgi:hypothetical protein
LLWGIFGNRLSGGVFRWAFQAATGLIEIIAINPALQRAGNPPLDQRSSSRHALDT